MQVQISADGSSLKNLSDEVYSFTKRRLLSIAGRSAPEARAALANLRRGAGRRPGELPELYGELLQDMPERMYTRGDKPSYAEWAVYIALTLYAMHQQSKDIKTDNMNRENISLGNAASLLVQDNDDTERIWKRLYVVAASDDIHHMSYHLRGLIKLLRDKDIPLDYPRLAKDLYLYQLSRESAERIRLSWGQDFYGKRTDDNEEDNNNEEE